MRIIKLKQNSPKWLKWRAKGIGGSDACAVMGDVGWTSPDELLAEKLGLSPVEDNERMARGRRLEPEARERYERDYGEGQVFAPVCVVHDTHPWLRASLDGLSPDRSLVLEIKCPGYWPHTKALGGCTPAYYKAQLQHQLLVTGCPRLHYCSYFPGEDLQGRSFGERDQMAVVEVLPDLEYQARLLEELRAFHTRVREAKAALKTQRGKAGPRRKKGG